jgi:hypothetical protein
MSAKSVTALTVNQQVCPSVQNDLLWKSLEALYTQGVCLAGAYAALPFSSRMAVAGFGAMQVLQCFWDLASADEVCAFDP